MLGSRVISQLAATRHGGLSLARNPLLALSAASSSHSASSASRQSSSSSSSRAGGSGARGPLKRLFGAGLALAAFGVAAGALGGAIPRETTLGVRRAECEESKTPLPTFTKEEVAAHKTPETGIWVSYRGAVYNVTEFVEAHPGGRDKIMLAAGGGLEPFWGLYQQHNTEAVRAILAKYQIGTLAGFDQFAPIQEDDPYKNQPERSPVLRVLTQKPFNGETPLPLLVASFLTQRDFLFIRNHLPVPSIDPATFSVQIEGLGIREIKLSLDDLKRLFKKHEIVATLQCSGNRRSEMGKARPIKGLDWEQGAIGTAKWGGVLLRDVLVHAGFDPKDTPIVGHVQFEGLDQDSTNTHYGSSIPVQKAFSEDGDVLLAFEMNGEPLTPDHGFPLRVIVPGVTGARSVKWVYRIVLSDQESQSHWQQKDYKTFPNTVDWHNVDWSSQPAMQDTNVQSVICEPAKDSVLEVDSSAPEVPLRGFAFSGGGRKISRVDVSSDGGQTWYPAQISNNYQPATKAWGWVHWSATVTLPELEANRDHKVQLVVRATDVSDNTQPEWPAAIWNLRGVANNSLHRVDVTLKAS